MFKKNRTGCKIKNFTLTESSGNAMADDGDSRNFRFSLIGDSVIVEMPRSEDSKNRAISGAERVNLENDLIDLIETYSIKEWDGYDEVLQVMDASHSFRLMVEYKNHKKINAKGFFMFPDNYNDVFQAVKAVFKKY